MNSGDSGPSSAELCHSLPVRKPMPASKFMFINETSQTPAYTRQDVRSHVQRQATRKSRTDLKWKPVAIRDVDHDALENPINATTEPANTNSSEITEPPHDVATTSCWRACNGQLKSRKINQRSQRKAIIVRRLQRPDESSPFQILGAGRIDPFLSYPVEDVDNDLHEVIDFVVTYHVPGLRPDDAPQHAANSGINTVSRAWFTSSLTTPLLFHALAFAGLVLMDILRSSRIYSTSPRALSHKLAVIQRLKDIVADSSKASREEVILTIMILAYHESLIVTEEKKKPFNSPLERVGWLNIYGGKMVVSKCHENAILSLLNIRGGIESLEMPGLAETLVGCDIMRAIHSFSRPIFQPLRFHESYIPLLKTWARDQLHLTSRPRLASTFWQLKNYGITDDMLEILNTIGCLTQAIDDYLQGKPGSLTLGQIARTRMVIEQRLLLLPSSEEIDITPGSNPNPDIYECCRLSAMVFGLAVVLPLPNTGEILQTYVTHLKMTIKDSRLEKSHVRNLNLSRAFLWILVMGGIAAADKPERRWFVVQLDQLSRYLELDWGGVEEMLQTFLWLDSACGPSGRDLWSEVESSTL